MSDEQENNWEYDELTQLRELARMSHRSIDWLLSELIIHKEGFLPTQSPVWSTVEALHVAICRFDPTRQLDQNPRRLT